MSDNDDDIPDWLDALVGLGIGALAIYFLSQLARGVDGSPPSRCPYCGVEIRKWARQCPRCRRPLVWR